MKNTHKFIELVGLIGWGNALLSVLILSCHFFIFRMYEDRLKDRQAEINRITEENRQYRDRFLKLMDSELGRK